MKGLSRRQRDVLDVIEEQISSRGYPPSVREIAAILGVSSAAGIQSHINALVKKGYLTKSDHLSRSLQIVKEPSIAELDSAEPDPAENRPGKTRDIPLLGYVAAGVPLDTSSQHFDVVSISDDLLRPGRKYFALVVRGDSMIEDAVLDGDLVILESRMEARDGEMVAALVNGQETTLKRIYRQQEQIRLQPANPTMEPLVLPADAVQVQGIVTAVIRQFTLS